jgi:multidrug efflux system membrane fusion protein
MLKDELNPGAQGSFSHGTGPAGSPQTPPRSSWILQVVLLLACVVIVVGIVVFRKRQEAAAKGAAGRASAQPPVPVLAGVVNQKDVPIYLDGLGTVQAFNTVTIHARVDGQLQKVAFTEGQDVHTGDLLAQIDPAPYKTQLDQNKAKKAQDEAQLANAKLDLKREADLYAAKIDSQQLYQTQEALVNQFDAAVKADQAAIDSAQVQLDYSTITSPLDGRTGVRQIDQGNIIHATDSNGLVVITQMRPISVIFTLPEQNLDDIHKQMGAGELVVLAVDRDNSTTLGEGKLAVIDNEIDTTTGTIKLKATFPNDDLRLWPGQFVNARLRLTVRKNGVVVPASVVQRGPDGAYAFVIVKGTNAPTTAVSPKDVTSVSSTDGNPKDRKSADPGAAEAPDPKPKGKGGANRSNLVVQIRPITVSQIEAGEALIDKGLSPGERVVVDGQYKLQAGSKVVPAQPGQVQSAPSDETP